MQPLTLAAHNPDNVKVVLAIVFLLVTVLLRYFGSQDPKLPASGRSVQWVVVGLSALSYIFLVYATGGRIWWHDPVQDEQLYAQIGAVALGIFGPSIADRFTRRR